MSALLIAVVAAVAGRPEREQAAVPDLTDQREQLVEEVLQRRMTAFGAGDEAAWLADVDPEHAEAVAYERRRFRDLRQLRPAFFRLVTAGGDLAGTQREPARGEVHVRQVMRLPDGNTLNTHTWCLTFRDGRALITAVLAYLPAG